jgi:hypothetical protein
MVFRAVGSFLCAMLASCAARRVPAPAPPPAESPSSTDWGALLFPPRAAAPPPEEPPKPAEPPEPPEPFAPSAYDAIDRESSTVFPDLDAYCHAALHDVDRSRSPHASRTPRCNRIPFGVGFAGNAEFQGVRAVRVVRGDEAYSALLVKVDRGFMGVAVAWDVEDPEDPGCPSIARNIGIERIEIQNGLLVVVALAVLSTMVEVPEGSVGDAGWRLELRRQVTVVKRVGETLHTRMFPSWSGPALGWKRQPRANRIVPWDRLMWRDWQDVRALADGTLDLPPP